MASEINDHFPTLVENKLANKPPIEITLTTFSDDENGVISQATTGTVKIDGEDEASDEIFMNCSLFKSALVKNLLVLSVGQFLLFMAFDSLANLQSAISDKSGFGTLSLAVIYGVFTISSFFFPTLTIKSLGCKKSIVFGMLSFCPYILGNFYPSLATLIPTAVLCGLVSGPLWSARSTYLNQISYRYAKLQRTSSEMMNAWFFSICTTFKQNTEIWGNLVSYYVVKDSNDQKLYLSKSILQSCGSDFCDEEAFTSNPILQLQYEEMRYVLVTVFTALVLIAAFFTALFLDPLESGDAAESEEHHFATADALATFYQFSKLDQILLSPLSLYTGLVNGFYHGDYTKAYVTCAWGAPHVASVSICYGVVSALVDSAGGPCVQVLGRAGLFFLGALAHLAMFLALVFWKPDPEHTAGFFLIASAHGIGNGVWMSQLAALYGVLFRDNEVSAFSCYYFLNSLGFLLAYSYSSYLCTNIKLFIPLSMLVVGFLGYLVVEIRLTRKALSEYELKSEH